MFTLPTSDIDPFVKYGNMLTMVRGIWNSNSEPELQALIGLQIRHEFVYNLISSALQEENAKASTSYKLY